MTETQQPDVLLIGKCQSPQFQRALSAGQAVGDLESVTSHSVNTVSDAIALVRAGELVPGLVVSYQSVPDEYSAADVDQLIGMLPLSRFVMAFSPWCESIGRTEQRWPSAWSVPLAHAASRIRFELRQLAADRPPLPATTSRDEAFATLAAGGLERADQPGEGMTARVISDDVPLKECYEQILRSVGFGLNETDLPDFYVVAAVLIDENQLRRIKELYEADAWSRAFATTGNKATILVASDMATPDARKRLLESGVTATFSQLRFAEELVDHLSTNRLSTEPIRHTHADVNPEAV